jgi:hypothetical protein
MDAHIQHPRLLELVRGEGEARGVGLAIDHPVAEADQLGEGGCGLHPCREHIHAGDGAPKAVGQIAAWPAEAAARIQDALPFPERVIRRDQGGMVLQQREAAMVLAVQGTRVQARGRDQARLRPVPSARRIVSTEVSVS